MAEMIKPKKEDIVVFGRIVSASTEGVVANAEQIYDGVSNIRQYEINKKFLSGNYTIGESNIKDGSITRKKIANWAVGRDQIEDGAITNGKILDRSVSTFKIEKGGIRTENIEEFAVTGAKLRNGCITAIKIQPGNIFTSHLDNKAVTSEKLANDVWDKIKSEYLQLNGGNMTGAIRWHGLNSIAIGENGIDVNNNDYYVSIDPSKHDERGCINIKYDETETLINNSNIELRAKEGESLKRQLILGDSDISMDAYTDNEYQPVVPIFSVSSDEDEGDTFVHGIGFATFNQDNIGFLVNDGSVGLAMSNSDIDELFQQVFQTVIG